MKIFLQKMGKPPKKRGDQKQLSLEALFTDGYKAFEEKEGVLTFWDKTYALNSVATVSGIPPSVI